MKRRGRSDGANEFQSTLPARGATTSSPASCCRRCHFNPRSPHGERLFINSRKSFASGFQSTLPARGATPTHDFQSCALHISIHAPRTGSDSDLLDKFMGLDISIHAPRTGSDDTPPPSAPPASYFNPRSPHGERQPATEPCASANIFQSTLPARGATAAGRCKVKERKFQSTLPARGATAKAAREALEGIFQSTLPARGATPRMKTCRLDEVISIHAPRTGSDKRRRQNRHKARISIHAPRTGSDRT